MTPMKFPTRLWPKGQKWAEYNEIIPAGIPLSTVMSRDYWLHIPEGQTLRPFDLVSCVAEDGTFDVDIRLLSKTSTDMKFRLLRSADVSGDTLTIRRDMPAERFVLKPGGHAGGWQVAEKATGNIIAAGLDRGSAIAEKERLEGARAA